MATPVEVITLEPAPGLHSPRTLAPIGELFIPPEQYDFVREALVAVPYAPSRTGPTPAWQRSIFAAASAPDEPLAVRRPGPNRLYERAAILLIEAEDQFPQGLLAGEVHAEQLYLGLMAGIGAMAHLRAQVKRRPGAAGRLAQASVDEYLGKLVYKPMPEAEAATYRAAKRKDGSGQLDIPKGWV